MLNKLIFCLLTALFLTVPAVSAQSKLPQELKGVRSINSDTAGTIIFRNSTAQTVKLYWLDFKGVRVFYQTLLAGESYEQGTFLNHPWVVTDANDNAWALHYAQPRSAKNATVINIVAPKLPITPPKPLK